MFFTCLTGKGMTSLGFRLYRFGIQKTIADEIVLGGDPFAIGGPVNLIFGFGEAYVNLIQSLVKSIFYRRFAYKIWKLNELFSKMAAGFGQKIFFAFFSYLTKNTYMYAKNEVGKN